MAKCEAKYLMGRYKGNAQNPKYESEYFYKEYLSERDKAGTLQGKTVRRVNAELHDEWKRKNNCNWYGWYALEGACLKQQNDRLGGDGGEGRCGNCINCQKCLHGTPPSISKMTIPFLKDLGYVEKYQRTDGRDGKRIWDNLLERSIKS